MAQLNGSFGSGGMTLSLTEPQFSCFIQYLKEEANRRRLCIKKAACRIGLQPSGDVWVLGHDIQVNALCKQLYVSLAYSPACKLCCILILLWM